MAITASYRYALRQLTADGRAQPQMRLRPQLEEAVVEVLAAWGSRRARPGFGEAAHVGPARAASQFRLTSIGGTTREFSDGKVAGSKRRPSIGSGTSVACSWLPVLFTGIARWRAGLLASGNLCPDRPAGLRG
jgi:hypothetical protein